MSEIAELIKLAKSINHWFEMGDDQHTPFPTERADLSLFLKESESHELALLMNSLLDRLEESLEERRDHQDQLEGLAAELQRSNRELEQVASVAAHDMTSPLAKISLAANMLYDEISPILTQQQRGLLDIILRGVKSSHEQISGIYKWSKVAKSKPVLTSVDLNRLISEICSIALSEELEESNGKVSIPETLPPVLADRSQIQLVLQNLIQNGLRYRDPSRPPHMTISSKKQKNGAIRITVTDNGIGIPKESLRNLFRMFSRVNPLRDQSRGLGIGLAHCRKIVKRHGGKMGVSSDPGIGSSFWFSLPAAPSVVED